MTPAHPDRYGTQSWVLGVALVLVLALTYGPVLVQHVRNASEDTIFNDDVRQQIPPFYRFAEPELAQKDDLGTYYLANFPLGFRALYTLAGRFQAAVCSSETLPYLLLAGLLFGIAITAFRLGGLLAAGVSVALCLASSIYLGRMAGGLPRSFALPLLAAWLAAATFGRIRIAAAIVAGGALFYPAAAFCAGVALAILLLLFPASFRGEAEAWTLRRRVVFLAVVAGVAALLLTPPMLSAGGYGPLLGPEDVDRFPEAGPGGRYGPDIAPPYPSFFARVPEVLEDVVFGAGRPWIEATRTRVLTTVPGLWIGALVLVSGLGWVRLARRDPAALRFLALLPAAALSYTAAQLLAPHLYVPARYAIYPMALLVTIGIPVGFAGLTSSRRSAAVGLGWLLLLLPVGGRGDPLAGLRADLVAREPDPIYQAVAALPPDSLIAGWPHGLMDNLPLVSHRAVLLNYESHQAFHRDFVLEMRERMNAVIDAYFATDVEPLLRLRDTWGVTHFVVEPSVLSTEKTYFRPFDATLAEARKRAAGGPFEILRQAETAAVFRSERAALLDLSRLALPPEVLERMETPRIFPFEERAAESRAHLDLQARPICRALQRRNGSPAGA